MTEAPTKSRRRWLRFSLRTLLVLIAIGCVWLGPKANRAQRQHRAVEAIRKLGGTVNYDYESDGSEQPPYPAWLRNLVPHDYLGTVITVNLAKTRVTDDDLQILSGLPDLVALHLLDCKITDVGIRKISLLAKLRILVLRQTDCTDQGLVSLKTLINMRHLNLSRTQISDEGLVALHHVCEGGNDSIFPLRCFDAP